MADDEVVAKWEYKGKDALLHGPQCGVRGDVLHDDALEECNLLALVPCDPPKMHVVVPERNEQVVLGNVHGTRYMYMLSGIDTFRVTASRLAPAPPAPSATSVRLSACFQAARVSHSRLQLPPWSLSLRTV